MQQVESIQTVEVVTQEQLEKKWLEYSKTHNRDIGAEALLRNHLPKLMEDNVVLVKVDNVFQQKEILAMNIISFLRSELINNELKLEVELLPEDEIKARLTPQELLRKMIEENPLIDTLRTKLDLEID